MRPFVSKWNLYDDSRLSVRANVVDFSHHAFPLAAVADMDAMTNVALSHNMPYGTA